MYLRTLFTSLIGLALVIGFVGCNPLNPSIMLKTKKDFVFDSIDSTSSANYKLSPDDKITVALYANKGFKVIDNTSPGPNQRALTQNLSDYRIELDSIANLPVIGKVKIGGLTIRECERFLEDKYSVIYKEPFAIVRVVNRRVMIFPGQYGKAKVITLQNENTTLMEGLAQAGGLTRDGKAKRIKLIRGDISNPKVFLFDMSSMEGYKLANITLQANDIIYVEPRPNTVSQTLREVAPILSIIASALSIYLVITAIP